MKNGKPDSRKTRSWEHISQLRSERRVTFHVSLIALCCLFVPILVIAAPPHAQVASTPTPTAGIFQQLVGTISNFYSVLLSSTSRTSSISPETPSPTKHEDGYILGLDGQRAHISLGRKDGIRQGMMLKLYRAKALHNVVVDQQYPIEESLGLGLVIEVFDETSIIYLSNFEVKVVVESDRQLPKPVVEVSDRVKRPVQAVERNMPQLPGVLPPMGKLPEFAHIVTVEGNQVYLDFSGMVTIDDKLTLIKSPQTLIHPVTGEQLVIGEERQATGRVFNLQEASTGVLLPPSTSNYFVAGDKVKIVKK